MSHTPQTEAWQRGPVPGFDALLMPVVHSLIQVQEDLHRVAADTPPEHVWLRPGGAASIGFHVRHIGGAVDRLFTYARDETLSDEQKTALRVEGEAGDPPATLSEVVDGVAAIFDRALEQLKGTPREALFEERKLGRAGLPTTVLGLLFHAAEHATRHAGQAITTSRILRESPAA